MQLIEYQRNTPPRKSGRGICYTLIKICFSPCLAFVPYKDNNLFLELCIKIENFTRLLLVAEAYAFVGGDVIVANLGAQVADMDIESARANHYALPPHGIENLLTGEDSTLGE